VFQFESGPLNGLMPMPSLPVGQAWNCVTPMMPLPVAGPFNPLLVPFPPLPPPYSMPWPNQDQQRMWISSGASALADCSAFAGLPGGAETLIEQPSQSPICSETCANEEKNDKENNDSLIIVTDAESQTVVSDSSDNEGEESKADLEATLLRAKLLRSLEQRRQIKVDLLICWNEQITVHLLD